MGWILLLSVSLAGCGGAPIASTPTDNLPFHSGGSYYVTFLGADIVGDPVNVPCDLCGVRVPYDGKIVNAVVKLTWSGTEWVGTGTASSLL